MALVFAAAAANVAATLAWTGWPEPSRVFDFPILLAAALGASFMTVQRPVTTVVMQPSLVIEFAALLLLGPNAAMLLAIVGMVMQRLMNTRLPVSLTLMHIAGAALALQSAGLVYQSLGGSAGQFAWPAQIPPFAAATLTYCLIAGVMEQAQSTQTVKTVRDLTLRTDNPRTVDVRVVPISGGVTILWQDVTARAQAERVLKRHEERLALAAEGANDGLWEWDLRTQEFYFSSRWLSMIGLPRTGACRPS